MSKEMLSDINDTPGWNNIFFFTYKQKRGKIHWKIDENKVWKKSNFWPLLPTLLLTNLSIKQNFGLLFWLLYYVVFLSGLVSSVSSLVVPFFQLLLWPFLAFTFTTEPPLLCYCFSGFSVSRVTAIEHVGMLYYALFY